MKPTGLRAFAVNADGDDIVCADTQGLNHWSRRRIKTLVKSIARQQDEPYAVGVYELKASAFPLKRPPQPPKPGTWWARELKRARRASSRGARQ